MINQPYFYGFHSYHMVDLSLYFDGFHMVYNNFGSAIYGFRIRPIVIVNLGMARGGFGAERWIEHSQVRDVGLLSRGTSWDIMGPQIGNMFRMD